MAVALAVVGAVSFSVTLRCIAIELDRECCVAICRVVAGHKHLHVLLEFLGPVNLNVGVAVKEFLQAQNLAFALFG